MPYLLLDDARARCARLYRDHIRRETLTAAEHDQLDALLTRGWAENLHAALRIPYEYGVALMGISNSAPPLILDWYRRLDHLRGAAIEAWLQKQHDGAPAGLLNLHLDADRATYAQIIATIHEHIRAGNTYQINHTLRLRGEAYGNPVALYQQLRTRQPAPYAALAWHPDDGHTLCLSPELFLARDCEQLHTLPMKGTSRAEGDIAAAKTALANDPKNRAENTMIVDLLRNDLGKIARPHGVRVSDAFHVEQHGEVLQMTSRVNAHLRTGIGYAAILRATYPCGSITGAPKHITMQYISALENSPRGLYTGALGYIERDKMRLNVAIRTLQIAGDGRASFGVGSGITIDSDADDEYRECELKAAFLHQPPPFGLIETLRIEHDKIADLAAHCARLQHSAAALGITYDPAVLTRALGELTPAPDSRRLKITLHPDGGIHLELALLEPLHTPLTCLQHPQPLPDRDPLRRYKTTHRAHLDHIWQAAAARGAFDALLYNQSGYLLEGARSNVFIKIDDQWHTPPLSLDILPGIARARILANPALIGAKTIHESHLSRDDITRARHIILTNSLRGILATRLEE